MNKKTNSLNCCLTVMIFVIAACVTCMLPAYLMKVFGITTVESQTLYTPRPIIAPQVVEINDLYDTGIAEFFLTTLQTAVLPYGDVTYYEAEVNFDKRLIVYTEVQLANGNYSESKDAMEVGLRTFSVLDGRAGSLIIHTSWERNAHECADNAGMGYAVMETIDWPSASQSDIFRALNKHRYGPGVDDTPYSDIAWAPDASGLSECNE